MAEEKGIEAEEAASKDDTRTFYQIARDLTDARCNSNVPIKNKQGKVLLASKAQDARWMEHFKETLNQPEPPFTFDFTSEPKAPPLPVDLGKITKEETATATKAIKNNKAAGCDEIAGEMLKYGGIYIVEELTKLLNICWKRQEVPQEWQQGIIVT